MENTQNKNINPSANIQAESTPNTPSAGFKLNKLGSLVVVALFIAIGVFIATTTEPPKEASKLLEQETNGVAEIRPISAEDHILGNPNAEIFIVEYSDTECPFCKMFHYTMHEVIAESDGNVAWVYRHFPIEQLHRKAFREALATECAAEQGGNEVFWIYVDQIYARTNSNDSLPDSELFNIAGELGLNMETFTTCIETEKYAQKVNNDITDARIAGATGTPSSFIVSNGTVLDTIPGASPKEVVLEKIQKALNP